MTWTVTEVAEDPTDPTVLKIAIANSGQVPALFQVRYGTALKAPKELRDFVLSLVTRRTTVNPGEVVKFRLKLPVAISDYPAKAKFVLALPHDYRVQSDHSECCYISLHERFSRPFTLKA